LENVIGQNKHLGPTNDNTDLLLSPCIRVSCRIVWYLCM